MPANRKERKATAKQIDQITAAFIRERPAMLKEYGKEAIRDHVLNDLLRRAFARLESFEGSNK
ncbi:hypothetical protein IHZ75_004393 [Salmonella enterica]|nr:hypothetical protein [Salmonella enterica]